jgi:hypothetical protein
VTLEQALHDEIVRLERRVECNRAMARAIPDMEDSAHEHFAIAHVQETIVIRLQSLLHQYDQASIPTKEIEMNAVKSLAGTGKDYCGFEIEVSGGEWGVPKSAALISNGGCGGTKRVALTGFELPAALPNGKYAMQAKVVEADGGCGAAKTVAHVQFHRPANTPSFVSGNRDYGWAFETKSPELIAALKN